MTAIVLVHGSYHGAWCWERLAPELERLGHTVTAIDLPISDPAAGASEYADAIEAQVDWSEPPAIVGHSSAGLTIPIVAARRPVRQLVFLAAMLPKPGMSVNEQRAAEPIDGAGPSGSAEWTDLGNDFWMVGPQSATEMFFPDAAPADAAWATSHLRPQVVPADERGHAADAVAGRPVRLHRLPRRPRDKSGLGPPRRPRAARCRTGRDRWRSLAVHRPPDGARGADRLRPGLSGGALVRQRRRATRG